MNLIIEVEDKDDFLSALNNAIVAYGDIAFAAMLGCEIPSKFSEMLVRKVGPDPADQYEFLKRRIDMLKDVYHQLDKEGN